jgi:hypothetical protein
MPTSTSAPAVTPTHQRLPSNQPGSLGSVNQSFVPPLINPKNAKAAKASATPNNAASRMITQNPGDLVSATDSKLEDGASFSRDCGCPFMI